ncbi:MAG: hypothetical protein ACPGXK_05910 [Phycisphaerae bacterium]
MAGVVILAPDVAVAGQTTALHSYRNFQNCFTGSEPLVGTLEQCEMFDLVPDNRVNQRDYAVFLEDVFPGLETQGDNCFFPFVISDGNLDFTSLGATTDGPDEPSACVGEVSFIEKDVWFRYQATCTGTTTVSTCGTSYDTMLAVYQGAGCPAADTALACSDDDCGQLFLASRVTFEAIADETYLIRVGGRDGASGNGFLHVECGQALLCPENATGDCLDPAGNGTPGCDDQDCCNALCPLDWYCCDFEWDNVCAAEAEGICGDQFPTCGTAPGDCFVPQTEAGCNDATCCQLVCEQDAFCCLDVWDFFCVNRANELCSP